MKKIKRALISVSKKNELNKILKILKKYKIEIISSGGTYKEIKKLGFKCFEVSNYTGSPEILDGRVKTLHPKIHAGILSKRKNKSHKRDLLKNNFKDIDLVVVNFYPFEETLNKTKNHRKIIENIDIGGPALVRAAAKNYNDVTVITNFNQYNELINELNKYNGSTGSQFREKMSREAFSETSYYDALITNYLNKISKNKFPNKKLIFGNLVEKLRYGENPHQEGAIYSSSKKLKIHKLNGKQLSYNNFNDIFSALLVSKSLPKNTGTVIIKHANPCGVSIHKNKVESYRLALKCDPISAFGGIVGCNFKLTYKVAKEMLKNYFEVVIANGFEKNVIKLIRKKKNLRLIDSSDVKLSNHNIVSGMDSFLFQTNDNITFEKKKFQVVSKIKPTNKIMDELIFSFNVCRSVKSNAIVIAQNSRTLGIGSGQPSRLDSCRIAIEKMKKFNQFNKIHPVVAASDAFFPFIDGIEKLVQAGVSAVIQPSGSIRDKEIIKFANKTNTILVFSKTRHFKH